MTSSNSYFQLGIPRIPLHMRCQWTRLGFCCKDKVSLTSLTRLPLPKGHSLYPGGGGGGSAIKLCQTCFCKMFTLSSVNGRVREDTESGTSLRRSRTAKMQFDKSLYFQGPQGLVASPARESAASGPP